MSYLRNRKLAVRESIDWDGCMIMFMSNNNHFNAIIDKSNPGYEKVILLLLCV